MRMLLEDKDIVNKFWDNSLWLKGLYNDTDFPKKVNELIEFIKTKQGKDGSSFVCLLLI